MSNYSTTLSSKNQFTLPVELLQKLGWKSGQKFSLFVQNNSIIIQNYQDIIKDIAKIVSTYQLPKTSIEQNIRETHQKFNSQKYQYED